jgi:hypothetical protein
MKFDKTVVHKMNMPYAIGVIGAGQAANVVCATEDHGPAVVIAPPWREARALVPGPGGCMALVPDPERPGDLYAIMGCFVGYNFQGGGVYRIRDFGPGAGWTKAEAARILDLPFAHRIGLVRRGGARYLLAANLAADKKDAADWSKPGSVIAARLDEGAAALTTVPVLSGVHKNHGFLLTNFDGSHSLLVGCAEGLFAVDVQAPGTAWPSRQVLTNEVSEMAVFDLDADGKEELVTIEPFHGSALRAYRKDAKGWRVFWEAELSFGHCVLAGLFNGRPSVIVSSRTGSRSLLLFQFDPGDVSRPKRIVVDESPAAANMVVLPHAGGDMVFSANQAEGEIAVYKAGRD